MAENVKKSTAGPRKPRTTKAKAEEPVVANAQEPVTANGATAETPGTTKPRAEQPTAVNGNGPKAAAPGTARRTVTHEEIRALAHKYWAERGYTHGNHEQDWLRAERELRGKAS